MLQAPPANRLLELERKYLDRFRTDVVPSIYYFWMNTTQPPFDDLKVRQAIAYAIDPAALQRIYDTLMSPTQQVLPPGVPGYLKFTALPARLRDAPQGLIKQANPSDAKVTVWTDDRTPDRRAGAYLQASARAARLQRESSGSSARRPTPPPWPTPRRPIWMPASGLSGTAAPSPESVLRSCSTEARSARRRYQPRPARRPGGQRRDQAPGRAAARRDHRGRLHRPRPQVMAKAPWAPWGNQKASTFTSERVDSE